MRKIFVFVLFVLVIACAHRSETVLKDTDYLKYGTRASVIEKVWGKPDETMAFQDYRAKGYYYHSGVGGSWGPYGGSVSGYGLGTTYTPTTIVWIYKDRNSALFFQQRGLLDEPYKYTVATIMVWKLVGWENLKLDKMTSDDKGRPASPIETKTVKSETSDWKFLRAFSVQEALRMDFGGVFSFYDASSIVYPSKNITKVWVRWYIFNKGQSFPSEIKDRPMQVFESLKLPTVTRLYEIDCSERRYRVIMVYYSTEEGIDKAANKNDHPDFFQSGEIVPEGDTDILWKMLCK
jgi:hypothetical protein